MNSLVGRLIGIVACGAIGGVVAWWFIGWIVLDGVLGSDGRRRGRGHGRSPIAAFVGWTTLGRGLERGR